MNHLLKALICFQNDKIDDCLLYCDKVLKNNEFDQSAWLLKMKASFFKIYVDDLDNDSSGITELSLNDNAISNVAKPGTSFKKIINPQENLNQAMRPMSKSGRPISGFIRQSNDDTLESNFELSIKSARNAYTARPISTASGRFVRLGTASMISSQDASFINLPRLNLQKYASRSTLNKSLFEYIYYHENDVRHALELAAFATEYYQFKDCWWKIQLGKCYFRLCLYRDAEQQFRSALIHQPILEVYLWLAKIFQKLDQPITSLEILQSGLDQFPLDISLLLAKSRIYENLNQSEKLKELFQTILEQDNMNVEIIASIASNYFYEDQSDVALKFYRRLFQMGVQTVELMNNLALCCFYSQQFDMCITCFNLALTLATKSSIANVFYNIGIVALSIGDNSLAFQNFRLALSHDNEHSESYNNLGVLEMQKENVDMAKAFLQASITTNAHLFESHFNFGLLAEKTGDLQTSYLSIKKSLNMFPNHFDTNDIYKSLTELFSSV